jgi:hypothetical protein
MRSATARTVPEPSAYRRLDVRHHTLGPAGSPRGRPGVSAARAGEYPATAADAVSGAVHAFTSGLCRYGMSPSPVGYLASEHGGGGLTPSTYSPSVIRDG